MCEVLDVSYNMFRSEVICCNLKVQPKLNRSISISKLEEVYKCKQIADFTQNKIVQLSKLNEAVLIHLELYHIFTEIYIATASGGFFLITIIIIFAVCREKRYVLCIPYITRVLNSSIQRFSIQSREHKIVNAELLS